MCDNAGCVKKLSRQGQLHAPIIAKSKLDLKSRASCPPLLPPQQELLAREARLDGHDNPIAVLDLLLEHRLEVLHPPPQIAREELSLLHVVGTKLLERARNQQRRQCERVWGQVAAEGAVDQAESARRVQA
eukprot:6176882-Pleurochrysis_carterae.AAC.4